MAAEKKLERLRKNGRLFVAAFIILSVALSGPIAESLSVSKLVVEMLIFSFLGLISYWIIPRPSVSYLRWVIVIECIILEWFIAFYELPMVIKYWPPLYVRVGFCSLLFLLSLYGGMHLLHIRKPVRLRVWALISLVLSVLLSLPLFFLMRNIE